MAALQKPAQVINKSYYIDAAVSTKGVPTPPEKTIYVSTGFHTKISSLSLYTANVLLNIHIMVNNIFIRYDADTDTI